jgi:hypothetical protein
VGFTTLKATYANWVVRPGVPIDVNAGILQDGVCCEDTVTGKDALCVCHSCYDVENHVQPTDCGDFKGEGKGSGKDGKGKKVALKCGAEEDGMQLGEPGTAGYHHFCANDHVFDHWEDGSYCKKCPVGTSAPFVRQYVEDFWMKTSGISGGTDFKKDHLIKEFDLRTRCLTFKETTFEEIWGVPEDQKYEDDDDKQAAFDELKRSVHATSFACKPGERWVHPRGPSETFNMATQYTAVTCLPCDGKLVRHMHRLCGSVVCMQVSVL